MFKAPLNAVQSRILRQESYKEMVVNYGNLFLLELRINYYLGVKIASDCGFLGVNEFLFLPKSLILCSIPALLRW
jgi:hypothetical protein